MAFPSILQVGDYTGTLFASVLQTASFLNTVSIPNALQTMFRCSILACYHSNIEVFPFYLTLFSISIPI